MWLAIVLWVLGALLLCGYGFVLLVAQAFMRRSRSESAMAKLIMAPGLRIGRGNALAIFLVSWACWSATGAAVIVVIYRFRN